MMDKDHQHEYKYVKEAMQWYGWGSPVGMGIFVALTLIAVGVMLWLLHLATII